jgi:hypothetical protein
MKITRKILRQWGACYTNARIATLVPAKGLTPLEIAALDIPATDRLWVLLREEIIPARELRLLVCDWAEAACAAAGWNDQRSLEAIAVARRFACGEATEAELAAAWSAAARKVRLAEDRLAADRLAAARLAAAAAWWTGSAAAWLTATAWSVAEAEQIADVVRVLKQIDEAGKEQK